MSTPQKTNILLIDDDVKVLQEVSAHLQKQGYAVSTAEDGALALKAAQSEAPDLVVLDITFPVSTTSKNRALDGMEVLQRLRESSRIPVIMLSSTNSSAVKAMALNIGADDYMAKPFDLHELSARVAAILRRGAGEDSAGRVLNFRHVRLDPGERRVWKDGALVELTEMEFDILHALARRPEHVFTREKLIEHAWADNSFCIPKAVDVHIGHIRKKIEDDPGNPTLIVTVRGTGYRFEDVPA